MIQHATREPGKPIPFLIGLFLFFQLCPDARAQDKQEGAWYIGTALNSSLSGFDSSLPFWLHANRNGLYDQHSANGIVYMKFFQPVFSEGDFSFSTSGRFYGRWSDYSDVGINMLSGTIGYKFLKLQAGKFRDFLGMNYHPLSSGSMLYSSNAEPVPRIALKTDGFVDVPLAQGYVQFSAYLSHGWLEDSRYIKNAWLHQKYLYLKIDYSRFEAIGGIVHNVQWGGVHPDYGRLPGSFSDYLRVVTGQGADESSDAPGGEISNVLGNSVAGYDFNLRVHFEEFRLTFYRLFYLEDKVSHRFRSPWDGMWGGGIIRTEGYPFFKEFLYEHINTRRQDAFDFEPRGTANYYNNFVYRSGWTYKNRVLGNPLLLADGSDVAPVYNNIIIAHHIGARGYISRNMTWKAYYTYSRNYGTYHDQIIRIIDRESTIHAELRDLEELKKVNHSLFWGMDITLPQNDRINIDLGVAMDFGELYPSTRVGVMAGCSYRFY